MNRLFFVVVLLAFPLACQRTTQRRAAELAAPEIGCVAEAWHEGAMGHGLSAPMSSEDYYGLLEWSIQNRARGCCYDEKGFYPCDGMVKPPLTPKELEQRAAEDAAKAEALKKAAESKAPQSEPKP